MKKKRKIVVTGGTGRFGSVLKKSKFNYPLIYPKKNNLNITKFESVKKYLRKTRPFCLIHLAGLSRPMVVHEKNISKSIELNIMGTSNIVRACELYNIKLIYFSTYYLFPNIELTIETISSTSTLVSWFTSEIQSSFESNSLLPKT